MTCCGGAASWGLHLPEDAQQAVAEWFAAQK